jgi:hypothetical protein
VLRTRVEPHGRAFAVVLEAIDHDVLVALDWPTEEDARRHQRVLDEALRMRWPGEVNPALADAGRAFEKVAESQKNLVRMQKLFSLLGKEDGAK